MHEKSSVFPPTDITLSQGMHCYVFEGIGSLHLHSRLQGMGGYGECEVEAAKVKSCMKFERKCREDN